jgi:hypothetical protein
MHIRVSHIFLWNTHDVLIFVVVGVMYSGEYDVCDVTLSMCYSELVD